MRGIADRDRRTAGLLEDAYVRAGAGPGGSGASSQSAGDWRSKRQHLAIPMDFSGDWLDIGCANGHLLATLPAWARERGLRIEPFGLELLPRVAELVRSLQPALAERIWTGSVMLWLPQQRFRYVTYTNRGATPRPLFDDLAAAGHPPDGVIHIERPDRPPLLSALINVEMVFDEASRPASSFSGPCPT